MMIPLPSSFRMEFHAKLWTAFFFFSFQITAFSPAIFPLLMEGIDRPEHNVLDDYRGRGSRKKSIYGRVTFTVVRKAPVTFEQSILSLSEYINYNILTTLSIVILGMRETSNVSIADSLWEISFFSWEKRERELKLKNRNFRMFIIYDRRSWGDSYNLLNFFFFWRREEFWIWNF